MASNIDENHRNASRTKLHNYLGSRIARKTSEGRCNNKKGTPSLHLCLCLSELIRCNGNRRYRRLCFEHRVEQCFTNPCTDWTLHIWSMRQPTIQNIGSVRPVLLTKTIKTVRVPSLFRTPEGKNVIGFYLGFDVVKGDLFFLICFQSIQAIKATLNFRHNSILLVDSRMVCRLDPFVKSSHPCPALRGKCNCWRPLKANHLPSHRFTYRHPDKVNGTHYYTPMTPSKEEDEDANENDSCRNRDELLMS